ncbi:MAG: hypothetical protein PHP17_06645 [Candidatus Omnitrophica bacterium]|nr:hypothetical protein [Candidatus Omnitrophota bacterium]
MLDRIYPALIFENMFEANIEKSLMHGYNVVTKISAGFLVRQSISEGGNSRIQLMFAFGCHKLCAH